MRTERLGEVRVGDGVYARFLQKRAIQEGMTVMVEKTMGKSENRHEIIGLGSPKDNGLTRLVRRRILETSVNNAVAGGELVTMIFSRSNEKI